MAADWWCCVFMSCLYPDNNLISWRSVELLLMSYFTDWHSCFRAVGPVMFRVYLFWLFICITMPSDLYFYQPFTLCTLHYKNKLAVFLETSIQHVTWTRGCAYMIYKVLPFKTEQQIKYMYWIKDTKLILCICLYSLHLTIIQILRTCVILSGSYCIYTFYLMFIPFLLDGVHFLINSWFPVNRL